MAPYLPNQTSINLSCLGYLWGQTKTILIMHPPGRGCCETLSACKPCDGFLSWFSCPCHPTYCDSLTKPPINQSMLSFPSGSLLGSNWVHLLVVTCNLAESYNTSQQVVSTSQWVVSTNFFLAACPPPTYKIKPASACYAETTCWSRSLLE